MGDMLVIIFETVPKYFIMKRYTYVNNDADIFLIKKIFAQNV